MPDTYSRLRAGWVCLVVVHALTMTGFAGLWARTLGSQASTEPAERAAVLLSEFEKQRLSERELLEALRSDPSGELGNQLTLLLHGKLNAGTLSREAKRRPTERLFELMLASTEYRSGAVANWKIHTHYHWGRAALYNWQDSASAYHHFATASRALRPGHRQFRGIVTEAIQLGLVRLEFEDVRSFLRSLQAHVHHQKSSTLDAIVLANSSARYCLQLGLLDPAASWCKTAQADLDTLAPPYQAAVAEQRHLTELITMNLLLAREDHEGMDERVPRAIERLKDFDPLPPAAASAYRLRWGLSRLESARGGNDRSARELFLAVVQDPHAHGSDRWNARAALAELQLLDRDFEGFEGSVAELEKASVAESTAPREQLLMSTLELRGARLMGRPNRDRIAIAERVSKQLDQLRRRWRDAPIPPGGYGPLQYRRTRQAIVEFGLDALDRSPNAEAAEAIFQQIYRMELIGSLPRKIGSANREAPLRAVRSELLRDQHALLIILPAAQESLVLSIDDHVAMCGVVERRDVLLERLLDWKVILFRPPHLEPSDAARRERRRDLERTGREFADAVLPANVRDHLRQQKRLSVVSADILGPIPWAALPALPVLEESGTTLGLTLELDEWPSTAAALALAERQRINERDAAPGRDATFRLVAAPTHSARARRNFPQLTPLPLTERDVEPLLASYAHSEGSVATGADATLEFLTHSDRSADVWHILAHGVADRQDQATDLSADPSASLILAPSDGIGRSPSTDGIITASELRRFTAPPLVIMTACGAAASPQRSGDAGIGGLAGALFSSGATAVVVPQQELYLEPTLILSAEFHRSLRNGTTPAAALMHARQRLAADDRFNDPHYYALLPAVGYAHDSVFEPSRSKWGIVLTIAVSMLLLLGIGVSAGRFRWRGRWA